jgi:hypothetical protein
MNLRPPHGDRSLKREGPEACWRLLQYEPARGAQLNSLVDLGRRVQIPELKWSELRS